MKNVNNAKYFGVICLVGGIFTIGILLNGCSKKENEQSPSEPNESKVMKDKPAKLSESEKPEAKIERPKPKVKKTKPKRSGRVTRRPSAPSRSVRVETNYEYNSVGVCTGAVAKDERGNILGRAKLTHLEKGKYYDVDVTHYSPSTGGVIYRGRAKFSVQVGIRTSETSRSGKKMYDLFTSWPSGMGTTRWPTGVP